MAEKKDIRKVLSSMKKKWADVQPRGGGFAPLPGGRYQFEIDLPETVVGQDSDGAIRARIMLNVVAGPDPELEGRRTSKSWTLVQPDGTPNDIGLEILKRDLEILGLEVDDLSKLAEALQDAAGSIVNATVRVREDSAGVPREQIFFNSLQQPGPSAKF